MASAPEGWEQGWQAMIAAVGTEFGEAEIPYGPDAVERGAVRRYLEPLEFDCPLHYDDDVARAHGYDGVIAPYTSAVTFTIGALWEPGAHVFQSAERNAQPVTAALGPRPVGLEPPATGFFATDIEIEWLRPIRLGDRLARHGRRLVGCVPKETTVGWGAFLTWESSIVDADGEVVAWTRNSTYNYVPKEAGQ